MPVFLFDQGFIRNPWFNLAMEEAIALHLDASLFAGGIRFWRNDPAIVLGISDHTEKNIRHDWLNQPPSGLSPKSRTSTDHPAIVRRCSGGGTVIHTPNDNLNFTIFASVRRQPELYPVRNSYEILLGLVSKALQKQNITAFMKGKSDLSVDEDSVTRKISGNAQFRKKNCIAHHGTLILNRSIIGLAEKYLLHPPEEPDYREKRGHGDFLTSLPAGFSPEKFKTDLIHLFAEFAGEKKIEITGLPRDRQTFASILGTTRELYATKYSNPDYIFRS